MMHKKKQMLLLAGLFLFWGWILWGQIFKAPAESRAEEASASHTVLSDSQEDLKKTLDTTKEVTDTKLYVADSTIIKKQKLTAGLRWERDPFFAVPATPAAAPTVPATQTNIIPQQIKKKVATPIQLTSTFLGSNYQCAVINRKLFSKGDYISKTTRLLKIGNGWVDVEEFGKTKKRVGLSKKN